jgi:hypothetical protein
MAVDPDNHLLVTADTSGEMKTWLIEGFCDGTVLEEDAEPLLKPGEFLGSQAFFKFFVVCCGVHLVSS